MKSMRIDGTAKLAAAFGALLFNSEAVAGADKKLDPRTARELSVIARVLEKRLSETRLELLTYAASPNPVRPAA